MIDEKTQEKIPYVENGYNSCVSKAIKIMPKNADSTYKPDKVTDSAKDSQKNRIKIELPPKFKLLKPKEMFSELRKYVIGQEIYLRDLSIWSYNHARRLQMVADGCPEDLLPKKMNMLILGASGTGKTLAATTMAKIIGLPIVITDLTKLTEVGYIGEDTNDILWRLLCECECNVQRAACGICVLDEVDKISQKPITTRDISGEGVQQSLLKILDGNSIVPVISSSSKYKSSNKESYDLDTSCLGFMAMGAFSGLKALQRDQAGETRLGFRAVGCSEAAKDDVAYTLNNSVDLNESLITYGLLPEFCGRFNHKTILTPLSVDELKQILKVPKDSIIKTETERFRQENIELKVTDAAITKFAENAYKKKLGGRSLAEEFFKITLGMAYDVFGRSDIASVEIHVDECGALATRVKKTTTQSKRSKRDVAIESAVTA
jgi:ATP-dependent Clp protease ATP-binding subunit ClpX